MCVDLTVFRGPLGDLVCVRNDYCHTATSKRIAIHHSLGNKRGKPVDIFDFLRCDVLALRQLEDVLGAIDDTD